MSTRVDRVTCPRCGANNFDTVSSCWKCQAPLGKGASAAPAPVTPAYAIPLQAPAERAYAPPQGFAALSGDWSAARRAALWLALLIPWLGLPIGWAFIMTGEPRKQEIGRYCVLWSSISMVGQTLIMFALSVPALNALMHLVPSIPRPSAGAGGLGGLGGLNGLGGQQ